MINNKKSIVYDYEMMFYWNKFIIRTNKKKFEKIIINRNDIDIFFREFFTGGSWSIVNPFRNLIHVVFFNNKIKELR